MGSQGQGSVGRRLVCASRSARAQGAAQRTAAPLGVLQASRCATHTPAVLLACPRGARRGGRDGREASCILFYGYGDATRMRQMIYDGAKENNAPEAQLRVNLESLQVMVRALSSPSARTASGCRLARRSIAHVAPALRRPSAPSAGHVRRGAVRVPPRAAAAALWRDVQPGRVPRHVRHLRQRRGRHL